MKHLGALQRYLNQGIDPGHFIKACLENDLMSAMARADSESLVEVHKVCLYIYNELPGYCWGDRETVRKWINGGGLNGERRTPGAYRFEELANG